jgi:hypothetical protein
LTLSAFGFVSSKGIKSIVLIVLLPSSETSSAWYIFTEEESYILKSPWKHWWKPCAETESEKSCIQCMNTEFWPKLSQVVKCTKCEWFIEPLKTGNRYIRDKLLQLPAVIASQPLVEPFEFTTNYIHSGPMILSRNPTNCLSFRLRGRGSHVRLNILNFTRQDLEMCSYQQFLNASRQTWSWYACSHVSAGGIPLQEKTDSNCSRQMLFEQRWQLRSVGPFCDGLLMIPDSRISEFKNLSAQNWKADVSLKKEHCGTAQKKC